MLSGSGIALTTAAAAASMAWAVRGRSSSIFAPSLWRGVAGRKALALTFDDGPTPSTPALLDLLSEYDIRATFFQVGENVAAYPEIAKATVAAGHELGNHSWSHPLFALKHAAFIHSEFARAQQTIAATSGASPTLVRAPYGVRWFGFSQMQKQLGLTGVMWSLIGLDWKLPGAAVAERILSRVQDGDIICLHDGRGTLKDPDVNATLDAVRRILPSLLEKGYHFETVTELLCPMK